PTPGFEADAFQPNTGHEPVAIARGDFIELCERLTAEDEHAFESLFRLVGLSVDWTQSYTTIGQRARRASQRAFVRLARRGLAYTAEAPTMWDVDFRSAIAQAEIQDREIDGVYHRIAFATEDGDGEIVVETSRPELIPACVAVVVNPQDGRYSALVGRTVLTPLFGVPVPVVAHELADPTKGTGAAQICTFGDVTDVVWWRELELPARVVIARDGTIADRRFGDPGWESRDPDRANAAMGQLAGLPAERARAKVGQLLREAGALRGEPQTVRHVVKFYEYGSRPLEVVTSRQWFVRMLDVRDELLERGRELRWHPPFMGARYASWVEGLNQDWALSRQRYFGVPFPIWYPLDEAGQPRYEEPIVADEDSLPVDPQDDVPLGFRPDQRGQPGGFIGDGDVMDTWATSSVTPQIAAGWEEDPDLFQRLFPMDVRPQAHEIIRTWLFYTVLKSHLEHGSLPWTDAAISGFVLDPDRKKMSKSKGNVVVPTDVFERHSADAVRYWAGSARLGVDAAFDEQQMRVGRRLAIKILNASRFVLSLDQAPGEITEPLDLAFLASLRALVGEATAAFEEYEHARALDVTERFFWGFTDDYLELVKQRAYGVHGPERAGSAVAALRLALDVVLRLFAPFLCYVTEEVWSWWREGSIHRAAWPTEGELVGFGQGDPDVFEVAAAVLRDVRKSKTLEKVSLKSPVERLVVYDTRPRLERLRLALDDVVAAGLIGDVVMQEQEGFATASTLAPVG
ncbi:MAG TPA: valine--tRNA ligase, partial [Actinomycetota bacterium]|nr:valine--tRNA ligase [Actinomycetota bacterium]